ncbi:hypothetical protein BTJ40_04330 [Microbulbifer sp. A4B17]|uniref:hypothetical protein n=1 Tax=Microbulbifer sp. A4B17 TaxID=359370 RepID=UPI000D52EA24|nr:hypothetical protein [Microbulbifer sp. A4B17]AWF80105.1 hypothetical protein BTJ40_04330 [Microbulbifer sp. A4B17]
MKVLFSNRDDWRSNIERQLNKTEYTPVFSKFTKKAVDNVDLVFPISIEDVLKAGQLCPDSEKGIFPSSPTVCLAENKDKFNVFLEENGFEEFLPKVGSFRGDFPYVLKGNVGKFGLTTYIINSIADEEIYRDKLDSEEYFCQEYVSGKEEYALHFIFDGGKFLFSKEVKYVYDQDLFVKGKGQGPVDKIWGYDCVFLDQFGSLLQKLDYRGFGCFNYKVNNGQLRILELNARIGGSMGKFIHEAVVAYSNAVSILSAKST